MKNPAVRTWICALILLALFIPVHLFALDQTPTGLYIDEVSMGYDAWCLVNYGVDRSLDPYPVYLKNYGGGQNALYTYLIAALISLTGTVSTVIMRIPAALFGLLTLIFGALIVHDLLGKKHPYAWFIFGLFYIVCPYYTMAARFGLESNLLMGMSTVFLYTLIRAVRTQKTSRFIVSGIAAGIVLYTYALSYPAMILFLLAAFIWLLYLRALRLRDIIAFVLPLAVLALPLIAVQVINLFDLPETVLFGKITLTKMDTYRSSELSLSHFFGNLLDVFKVILCYDSLPANTNPDFWTFYPISVPFIIAGGVLCIIRAIRSIRTRAFSAYCPVLFWAVAVILTGALVGGTQENLNDPCTYRTNGVMAVAGMCGVLGFFALYDVLRGQWKRVAAGAGALIYAACGFLFMRWYFAPRDTIVGYLHVPDAVVEAIDQAEALEGRTIYMWTYDTYYLYATLTSPYEYNLPEREPGEPFNGYVFAAPESPFDMDAVYVAEPCVASHYQELIDAGFHYVEIGDHCVYLPPEIDPAVLQTPA